MTGLTYQRLPWLVRRRHALPYAVALIRDHETRYFVAAAPGAGPRRCPRSARRTPAPSCGSPRPPRAAADELIRAVHDGVLGVDDVDADRRRRGLSAAELRAALTAGLQPDRRRAAELSSVATSARPPDPRRLLAGAGAGRLLARRQRRGSRPATSTRTSARRPPPRSRARRQRGTPDDPRRGRLRGRRPRRPHELLRVHPRGGHRRPGAAGPGSCHELEDGRRYYVIVTGANGLYRYDLNDVVEVRGFHGRTPKVAFVRKGRDMLNITGEKLHLNHVLHAVRAAERATGLAVWQFRLIPDVDAARYDLLIEPPRPLETPNGLGASSPPSTGPCGGQHRVRRPSAPRGGWQPPRLCLMRAGWSERLCRAGVRARPARDPAQVERHPPSEWDDDQSIARSFARSRRARVLGGALVNRRVSGVALSFWR